MDVSEPTLTEYIKILEIERKIESFSKPEDRRNTWYRIKPENSPLVNADIGKYEIIQFIDSLKNPIYGYEQQGNVSASIFAVKPTVKDRTEAEKSLKTEVLPVILAEFEGYEEQLKKGEKLVFVVTLEGKEGEKKHD
jgi:hypothetical protein